MKKSQSPLELRAKCRDVAAILKNLSHPGRLLILCLLCDAPRSVGELEQACGISQSAVSQFLNRMKLEGLVDSRREGRSVVYAIEDVKVRKLVAALQKIFCGPGAPA